MTDGKFLTIMRRTKTGKDGDGWREINDKGKKQLDAIWYFIERRHLCCGIKHAEKATAFEKIINPEIQLPEIDVFATSNNYRTYLVADYLSKKRDMKNISTEEFWLREYVTVNKERDEETSKEAMKGFFKDCKYAKHILGIGHERTMMYLMHMFSPDDAERYTKVSYGMAITYAASSWEVFTENPTEIKVVDGPYELDHIPHFHRYLDRLGVKQK